jgi:hypothetical protein
LFGQQCEAKEVYKGETEGAGKEFAGKLWIVVAVLVAEKAGTKKAPEEPFLCLLFACKLNAVANRVGAVLAVPAV